MPESQAEFFLTSVKDLCGEHCISTVHIGYSDWPSSQGVEVAIDSAVAIYVMLELQVPLGLRSLRYRQRGRYIQGRYIQWALYFNGVHRYPIV